MTNGVAIINFVINIILKTILSSIRNQANKVYTKAKSYYYACRNKRGFTILETGRFKRRVKDSSPKLPPRQYLTTFLFDKLRMHEAREIRFASVKSTIINFIVPISYGRIETVKRFLRNWLQIFEADRALKLILSFSGNETEFR